MQPKLIPPGGGRARPNSLIMVVESTREYASPFLGAIGVIKTLEVWGIEIHNGSYAGRAAIFLRGTRINGVIPRGHYLDIPRSKIGPDGRAKCRLVNLSTGREVYSEYNFWELVH